MEKVLCSSGENWKVLLQLIFCLSSVVSAPDPSSNCSRSWNYVFVLSCSGSVLDSSISAEREGVFENFYFCCNFLRLHSLHSCSFQLLTNCSLTPPGFSATSKNTTFFLSFQYSITAERTLAFLLCHRPPHNRECILIFRWASILCMCQIPLVGGDVLCWYWRVKHTQQSVNLKI